MKMNGSLAAVSAAALAAGLFALMATDATARTFTTEEYLDRDRCYEVQKMPAIVEYNTRGIPVRDSSRSWQGNLQKHGARVVDKYSDPVYIRTRQVIDDQHITLVPVSC